MPNGLLNAPIPSLFPDLGYQSQNKIVRGNGQLSWLSSKAGVIQCSSMNATVSFQLKDFCDQVNAKNSVQLQYCCLFQGVTDFTSVLRPGFRLAFQAVANDTNNEWIANYVSPLQETVSFKIPITFKSSVFRTLSTRRRLTWRNSTASCRRTFVKLPPRTSTLLT